MKHIGRTSIASHLIEVVSLIIIIIFIVLGISFYSFANKIMVDRVRNETNLKAEVISKDINSIFSNAKIVIEQMATNQQFSDYINSVNTRGEALTNPLYKDVSKTLRSVKATSELYDSAWIAGEKASFFIDNIGYLTDAHYVIKKRPWYSEAMNTDRVVFSAPYIDYSTKKIVFSAVKQVKENKKVAGFVALDISFNSIPEIFKVAMIGKKGKNFLISRDGSIIYRDDKKLVKPENIFQSSKELKLIEKKVLSGKNNFDEIIYEHVHYYVVNYQVKDTDWIVISLIDKNEAMKNLVRFTIIIIVLFILAVTLLILLTVIAVNKNTKPISTITAYAEDIANGEFDKDLPLEYFEMQDEFGDLAKAFQTITKAFRKENTLLEEKIIEKNKEIEKQYRYIMETEKITSLGNLVAGVAHEINTPLGIGVTTVSYLEKINNECRKSLSQGTLNKNDLQVFMEEVNDSIGMMNLNLGRAVNLIKNFKKLAVDQISENIVEFSLKENIEGVVLSMKHEYKNTKHKIFNNTLESIIIKSDPGVFSQIFTNLLMNSLKHGFANKETGNIYINCFEEEDKLFVIYSDDGAGIAPENINKIYEPFFTTDRKGGGSGLGLHIVHNLIFKKLKGTIQCESKYGSGVKFTIELPANNKISYTSETN